MASAYGLVTHHLAIIACSHPTRRAKNVHVRPAQLTMASFLRTIMTD